jgi:hypothetical protein
VTLHGHFGRSGAFPISVSPRLLTRAAQKRSNEFATSYRAATVRERGLGCFFSSLPNGFVEPDVPMDPRMLLADSTSFSIKEKTK